MSGLKQEDVLRYQQGRRSQITVKRHYIKWRLEQSPPIPIRCDEPRCKFNNDPLMWNGEELKLLLDHKNGVSGDNRPKNLQLLCPNCNSQQPTHGGGNKGKVEQSKGGFARVREDGKKDYTLPAESGRYDLLINKK
jgi:5-methylcytosine-specific restriction endonuclease McrA